MTDLTGSSFDTWRPDAFTSRAVATALRRFRSAGAAGTHAQRVLRNQRRGPHAARVVDRRDAAVQPAAADARAAPMPVGAWPAQEHEHLGRAGAVCQPPVGRHVGRGVLSPELVGPLAGATRSRPRCARSIRNARLTETETSGGEGGLGPMGCASTFRRHQAPKSAMGTLGYDLRASNFGELKNPHAGGRRQLRQRHQQRERQEAERPAVGEAFAPLLVGVAAPYAGGALAGMGIGGTAV